MRPGTALANAAWLAANVPAWRSFQRALRNPAETQRRLLVRTLRENAESAYGRAHGFAELRSPADFQRRVPIIDHADLAPWITRIMGGEQGMLTCEPITRLLPTSGTTGGSKLIPFTAGLQREFNRAIGPWMVDLNREHPALALGCSYWSISPQTAANVPPSAVPVGFDDDSAYLGGIRRRLVEATLAVSPALRLVRSLENNRYLTLLSLLHRPDWSFASCWHPSFLTLLLDALPSFWEELLEDVRRGGSGRAVSEAPEVRRALSFAPQPRRAEELRRVGPQNLRAIWPGWRVVSCWGHHQAALPLLDLQRRLPDLCVQPKGLLATEAFVSVPFQGRHPLAICSHFFEFVDAGGTVRLSHELAPGERYSVLVTTAGGLWRYRLGDFVEVDGLVENTPSIRFVGRGGDTSDLCGEKLAGSFVTEAVLAVCQAHGFQPPFALLAPEIVPGEPPRYVLFVEGVPPEGWTAGLEQRLRDNPHYALCRDLGQLGALAALTIPAGAYETFCRVLVAEGQQLGSIKPQSLSTRTDWRWWLAPQPSREARRDDPADPTVAAL